MSSTVTLTTGARLHFGLLAYGETAPATFPGAVDDHEGNSVRQVGLQRRFGGIGLMVDAPQWRLTVSKSLRSSGPPLNVSGASPEVEQRIRRIVQLCRQNPESDTEDFSFHVQIHDDIALHHGLGAGTQLSLAVGQALSVLTTGQPTEVGDLARATHRGRRSAIGVHGFQHGGFLVDAGKRPDEFLGLLAARVAFPAGWRLVLITPQNATGLAGPSEEQAFLQLQRMPAERSDRLAHIVLTELLPAVRYEDFEAFSDSLFAYGSLVGESFSSVQGGRIAHPVCKALVHELRREGIRGVAQSSWGPTIAVAFPDQRAAEAFLSSAAVRKRRDDCRCRITSARNRGAEIDVAS